MEYLTTGLISYFNQIDLSQLLKKKLKKVGVMLAVVTSLKFTSSVVVRI